MSTTSRPSLTRSNAESSLIGSSIAPTKRTIFAFAKVNYLPPTPRSYSSSVIEVNQRREDRRHSCANASASHTKDAEGRLDDDDLTPTSSPGVPRAVRRNTDSYFPPADKIALTRDTSGSSTNKPASRPFYLWELYGLAGTAEDERQFKEFANTVSNDFAFVNGDIVDDLSGGTPEEHDRGSACHRGAMRVQLEKALNTTLGDQIDLVPVDDEAEWKKVQRELGEKAANTRSSASNSGSEAGKWPRKWQSTIVPMPDYLRGEKSEGQPTQYGRSSRRSSVASALSDFAWSDTAAAAVQPSSRRGSETGRSGGHPA